MSRTGTTHPGDSGSLFPAGRPRLLDLFCGAGGCSVGYARAGFDVVGVDHLPQPRYPYVFHKDDALAVLDRLGAGGGIFTPRGRFVLSDFDAIHASPPCQAYSSITRIASGNRNPLTGKRNKVREHPDLIAPVRTLLLRIGLPYVIENVEFAPLINPVRLCGSMFDPPLDVRRHRLFETDWGLRPPDWPCRHKLWAKRFRAADYRGRSEMRLARVVPVYGGTRYAGDHELRRRAMEIDWMSTKEITQAIPPRYTEFIGRQLVAHVTAVAA